MPSRLGKLSLTKLEAARRQLEAAVRLHASNGDPVAIHTLASAAFQVLTDLNKVRGRDFLSLYEVMLLFANPEDRKKIQQLNAAPENFFKHADKDPAAVLHFEQHQTEVVLFDACMLFSKLCSDPVPILDEYQKWMFESGPWADVQGLTLVGTSSAPGRLKSVIEQILCSITDFRWWFDASGKQRVRIVITLLLERAASCCATLSKSLVEFVEQGPGEHESRQEAIRPIGGQVMRAWRSIRQAHGGEFSDAAALGNLQAIGSQIAQACAIFLEAAESAECLGVSNALTGDLRQSLEAIVKIDFSAFSASREVAPPAKGPHQLSPNEMTMLIGALIRVGSGLGESAQAQEQLDSLLRSFNSDS